MSAEEWKMIRAGYGQDGGTNDYIEQYAGDGVRHLRSNDTFKSTGTVCFFRQAAQGESGLLERTIFILDADAVPGCKSGVKGASPILVSDRIRNRKAGGADSAKRKSWSG
jgi:hypothetical protein